MKTLKIYGSCVYRKGAFNATVVINSETGLIEDVLPGVKARGAHSMGHRLIFPGFIDVHVHGRQDATGEESYKEDFETLGQAALNGGVVHVAEMGNNPKPPIDDESYTEKMELTKKSLVPVTLYAMMGPETNPLASHVPYKLCHARTTGKNDLIFFPSQVEIEKAAGRYHGKNVSHHCEDAAIINGNSHKLTHEDRRPAEAEVSAVDFAIYLTEKFGLRSKLCHCSVCTGIEKIVAAKRRGVLVTCEITPHHLYFDQSMITPENSPWMQMNPPLRPRADRLYCIEALRRGEIDMVASDHAPHREYDKLFLEASGQPHLDTLGPFTTWLMSEHEFRPGDIARVCSVKPAGFLLEFLPPSYGKGYGQIARGYVGSLTVIDTESPVTITKPILKTKCGWSPFEGVTFPGSVFCTIVRGKMHFVK